MKFFLKSSDKGFEILDGAARLKYTVSVKTDRNKQKIIIKNSDKKTVAEILRKQLVFPYFSVRCKGHFYVLVPMIKDCFVFVIYGSTYRFLGDISAGRFSLIDVDKSPVMTQDIDPYCYTLEGRRLNARPSTPGLYIHGKKKVVIR